MGEESEKEDDLEEESADLDHYCETCGDFLYESHYHCAACGEVCGLMGHMELDLTGKYMERFSCQTKKKMP